MVDVIRRHLHITGRVQGVFFRASTRETAKREGVTGWVQNMPDGSVVAELQGPAEAVRAVEAFCREGPAGAQVRGVSAEDVVPVEAESRFETR